jgi:ubiquinol-cytochrome c reductase cytochrome b subunit
VSVTQPDASSRSWTVRLRKRAVGALPPEKLLPDGQPSYVSSWIYVFGVLSLSALATIILSGCILALKGPEWWHLTGIGHFFNSIHLWSVELFFFFMVVHLWGKYWMAAWRGGRARVWITGAVTFLVAIPCALTGYVSQQNFDAQWISSQAKDAMNATGVGAFFNLLNFGQMYSYHILLLPAAVVVLVVAHVLLVRKHGVVPPFELAGALAAADGGATDTTAVGVPVAAASGVAAPRSADGAPAEPVDSHSADGDPAEADGDPAEADGDPAGADGDPARGVDPAETVDPSS